jgi:hypothetical protein
VRIGTDAPFNARTVLDKTIVQSMEERAMATQVTINDPAEAKTYFETKMAFTTGPVELERW